MNFTFKYLSKPDYDPLVPFIYLDIMQSKSDLNVLIKHFPAVYFA